MKQHMIAGLDAGSHALKMGIARKNSETGDLEVLSMMEEESFGVRKGTVVNPEGLSKRIASLKEKMELTNNLEIEGVYTNIGGAHLYVTPSHGAIVVSRADQQISQEDVDRVLQAARTFSLPRNKEILDVFPLQFIVDGEGGIKEVVGMKAVRLEVDVLAQCGFSPYIKNLTDAVLGADLEIYGTIASPLMSVPAVLSPQQKELGVAVVDIGAGTTTLAVFSEGDLIHAIVFPVGSENMTNDLAIGLRTEHEAAERIKVEYGSCVPRKGKKMETIDLPGEQKISFSPAMLSHILEARIKEIFLLISKELKKLSKDGMLPGGVVLVGGGAKLPGLVEFAKKELKLPARLGTPQGLLTGHADPQFLGVMGLIVTGAEAEQDVMSGVQASDFGRKIKKLFKIFIP